MVLLISKGVQDGSTGGGGGFQRWKISAPPIFGALGTVAGNFGTH